MITHFKKARAIYNLVGMPEMAKEMDTAVSVLTANKQSKATKEGISSTDVIHHLKSVYKQSINNHGIDSEATIQLGLAYARVLWDENCRIEAERLVTKLATISRRVHGPDHKVTVEADELVNNYMERQVFVLPETNNFRLCNTKMMEKSVSSKALLQSQGIRRTRIYIILQIIS